MRTSAIALQREWIERLLHEQGPLGKAKDAAAKAPIRDKAGRTISDIFAADPNVVAAVYAAVKDSYINVPYDLEPESKDMGDAAGLAAMRKAT
jgi:hypothetical protein